MSAPNELIPTVRGEHPGKTVVGHVLSMSRAEGETLGGTFWEWFVRLAGGPYAVVAVVSCAATNPARTGQEYVAQCRRLGVRDAGWIPLWQRCDADAAEVVTLLRQATGIVLTDGDQSRLVGLLADTRALATIHRRYAEGAVVAGVGAGARLLPPPATSEVSRETAGLIAQPTLPASTEAPSETVVVSDLIWYQPENALAEWSGF
jgi:cyanophycinase-like exopeptidase